MEVTEIVYKCYLFSPLILLKKFSEFVCEGVGGCLGLFIHTYLYNCIYCAMSKSLSLS